MKKLKKMVSILLVVLAFIFVFTTEGLARRGGSFRSSSRSRSTSSKSIIKSSKAKTSSPKKKSTAKRSIKAPKRSATQQKSYEAAKKSGTAFKSKNEAVSSFKTKNSTKYTSKYSAKPAIRPAHVPQITKVGGVNYNVTYYSGHGGYGYRNSLGAFILYDAMLDTVMLSMLMRQNNYYYDTHPARVVHPAIVVHPRRSGSFNVVLITLIVLVVIVFIAAMAFKKK